jgi:hypothetical protein
MERRRELALAPGGKKSLMNRVQQRKKRLKEDVIGAKKHEEALQEILKRKKEVRYRKPTETLEPVRSMKGASAGIRTSNKYVRDFQNQRNQIIRKQQGKHACITPLLRH